MALHSCGGRMAAILAAISDRFVATATWVGGISPVMGPIYASGSLLPVSELSRDLARSVPRAFWFWQTVGFVLAVHLLMSLRRSRKAIAKDSK